MYRIVVLMGLLAFLTGSALAETSMVTDALSPLKGAMQYTVTDAQGNKLFEIARDPAKEDIIYVIRYTDSKEFFIQPMPGQQGSFILFDNDRVLFRITPQGQVVK